MESASSCVEFAAVVCCNSGGSFVRSSAWFRRLGTYCIDLVMDSGLVQYCTVTVLGVQVNSGGWVL